MVAAHPTDKLTFMGTFLTPALKSPQSGFFLVNDRTGLPIVTELEIAVDSASRRKGLLGRDGLAESTRNRDRADKCCAHVLHAFSYRYRVRDAHRPGAEGTERRARSPHRDRPSGLRRRGVSGRLRGARRSSARRHSIRPGGLKPAGVTTFVYLTTTIGFLRSHFFDVRPSKNSWARMPKMCLKLLFRLETRQ